MFAVRAGAAEPDPGASPRFELAVRAWRPAAALIFSSDGPDLPGTPIDGRSDLAMTDRAFPQVAAAVVLSRHHAVGIEFTPISFDGTNTLSRDVAFSGRVYPAATRARATIDWTALQVEYEYRPVVRERWRLGVAIQLKATRVRAALSGDGATSSRATSVPVPAAGPTVVVALTRRLSIASRFTAMAVPDSPDRRYGGHYLDLDATAIVALARRVAAEAGWRDLDLRHLGDVDSAKIRLRGVYVGVRLRR